MSLGKVKKSIEDSVSVIIGEYFRYVSRAADMLTLGFGNDVEYVNPSGEKRNVAQFSIHIQTSWRIVKKGLFTLGSYDFYLPKEGISYEVFREDDNHGFGISEFDEISGRLNKSLESSPIKVVKVDANCFGDLHILMEDGTNLEVFVNSSRPVESWRFFEAGDDTSHLVVFEE